MNVQTYKVIKYKGCPVYFRSIKNHFEYLTIINSQLYTAHISVRPTLINKLLYWARIEKAQYSEQQLGAIIKQINRLAETTIDFILDKKEAKRENK